MTTYVIAGGCFWCLDAVYRRIKGVDSVVSGYSGGDKATASYYQVASGDTAHAEAVEVTFDEAIVSPEVILGLFFTIHDPTTLNRQGADVGPQYRSAMFYANDEQRVLFETAAKEAQPLWDAPLVTEIVQLDEFYPAEPEHQNYFNNNPGNGYCTIVIAPKIIKARSVYSAWFTEA